MKRISNLLILSIFIASCSNGVTPATNVTVTSEVTVTFTSVPTELPTTPTETPDPNMPEGATGKDENGNWIKTVKENGKLVEVTWNIESHAWLQKIFSGAFFDVSQVENDTVNITGKKFSDQFQTDVWIDPALLEKIKLPTLSHSPNLDAPDAENFATLFFTQMVKGLHKNGLKFNYTRWDNHELSLSFDNADGPQKMGVWDGVTNTVQIRGDYIELKANIETNGFVEVVGSSKHGEAITYLVKVWTDEDNNLHTDIAPDLSSPAEWTQDQIEYKLIEMQLWGISAVFESKPGELIDLQTNDVLTTFLGYHDKWPYFEFGWP